MKSYIQTDLRNFTDCSGYTDVKTASYFGMDRSLSQSKIIHLLVSNSFGANSILYAVWLGYLMGMWSLIIHIAWCISFLLLIKFSKIIYSHTSIHDFLDCCFGSVTKRISAICSIIGMIYFMAWEITSARSGLSYLENSIGGEQNNCFSIIIYMCVIIALLYSIIGGQRMNGYINIILNFLKEGLLVVIIIGIFIAMKDKSSIIISNLFPNPKSSIQNIGIIGLFSNIIFNLLWQFVDNSTWQIISYGVDKNTYNINKNLKKTSAKIFVIYFTETILGASLRSIAGLNSDNILSGIIYLFGSHGNIILLFLTIFMILLSVMSLVDGISLSTAQTIMVDLKIGKRISKKHSNMKSQIRVAQILTFCLGIIGAWVIQIFLNYLGKNIFDFVYVFTVVQLGLIGPILIALFKKNHYANMSKIYISIPISIITGLLCNILGNLKHISWITEMSGAITIFVSCIMSISISGYSIQKWKSNN